MQAIVHRLSMRHPGDVSALEALILDGSVAPRSVVAVIGKTEGNGGVNDFTRGYFTQSLMGLLAAHRGASPAQVMAEVPCVLSGGTEGVLSPHYLVFCRVGDADAPPRSGAALAVGVALSAPMPAQAVGRVAQIESVAQAVRRAMHEAAIDDPADVHFVQVKCPCVTVERAREAIRQGHAPITTDPNRSMALARAAGAFGVGLALGELSPAQATDEAALLRDFDCWSGRASISSGVEVDCNEVIVLGNSRRWTGPLRIAHRTMVDALDLAAVQAVAGDLGLPAHPSLTPDGVARVHGVLVKCEPDRRGQIRGYRHTMLDDTDINAQRHIRGALGGLVAAVFGDGRVFVSGGAEHQGPDGGGLIAVIASDAD